MANITLSADTPRRGRRPGPALCTNAGLFRLIRAEQAVKEAIEAAKAKEQDLQVFRLVCKLYYRDNLTQQKISEHLKNLESGMFRTAKQVGNLLRGLR